jgi:hypothetical protein
MPEYVPHPCGPRERLGPAGWADAIVSAGVWRADDVRSRRIRLASGHARIWHTAARSRLGYFARSGSLWHATTGFFVPQHHAGPDHASGAVIARIGKAADGAAAVSVSPHHVCARPAAPRRRTLQARTRVPRGRTAVQDSCRSDQAGERAVTARSPARSSYRMATARPPTWGTCRPATKGSPARGSFRPAPAGSPARGSFRPAPGGTPAWDD